MTPREIAGLTAVFFIGFATFLGTFFGVWL